jgi:hypothetical protein
MFFKVRSIGSVLLVNYKIRSFLDGLCLFSTKLFNENKRKVVRQVLDVSYQISSTLNLTLSILQPYEVLKILEAIPDFSGVSVQLETRL